MCFSMEASFGASALLLGTGVAAAIKATSSPQRMLALIPLLFSVQQFAEGWLWLGLNIGAGWRR